MSKTSKGRLPVSVSAVIFSEIQLSKYLKVNTKWFFSQNESQTNIFSIFSLFTAVKELLLQVGRIVLVNPKCDNMISDDESTIKNFKIPAEWIYRGEGNCNVVLSLPKSRKILRIRKTDKPRSLIGWIIILISDLLHWYCGKCFGDEIRDMQFYSMVMRPLIGSKYTSQANQVILSRKQIKILENELCKYRPEYRKHKSLQYGRAAIFDDFAFLPVDDYKHFPFNLSQNVYAVEIKPKQGWRPLTEKHFPECFFCMNQYLKKEKNQIKEITKYCPEDLFSGNQIRMKNAIKSLIRSPQNNFKIFKNGKLLYGEKTNSDVDTIFQEMFEEYSENNNSLEDEFCNFIQKCLTRNLNNSDITIECHKKLFCEWNKMIQGSNNSLPEGCVLEKILSVQMLDAEGSRYYKKLLTKNKFMLEDWTYVKKLSKHLAYSDACLKCSIMTLHDTEKNKDFELACAPYLISATAKDCSLMVTFKRIQENVSDDLKMKSIMKTKYGDFLIDIGVFDLYPKPLSTIRKHDKRNRAIYEAYMRSTVM